MLIQEKDMNGLGMFVTLNRIATINKPQELSFYFSNFFTTFELMINLQDQWDNKMNKCPIKIYNEMKKEFYEAFKYRYDEMNGIFEL